MTGQLSIFDFIAPLPAEEVEPINWEHTCFASYVTFDGVGVRTSECTKEHRSGRDCDECEANILFNETVEMLQNQPENLEHPGLAGAYAAARALLGIPTAYDGNGRIKQPKRGTE